MKDSTAVMVGWVEGSNLRRFACAARRSLAWSLPKVDQWECGLDVLEAVSEALVRLESCALGHVRSAQACPR